MDNLLRRHYPKGDLRSLAARLGVSYGAVKGRAARLGIVRRVNVKRSWTQRQLDYLRQHYADTPMAELKRCTGHAEKSIWQRAATMGLRKSKEFLQECGRRAAQHPNNIASRFQKGQTPWNKGMTERQMRNADAIERCRKTQFKAGQKPYNTKPIGYEHINKDGYVAIKVADGKPMMLKHRWVWQQEHGEIPHGMVVTFRDGNRLNCSLDNLELISRTEAVRRQTRSETPEQRKARMEKATAKRNARIRLDKIRIHWGLEPISKLVKRWHDKV